MNTNGNYGYDDMRMRNLVWLTAGAGLVASQVLAWISNNTGLDLISGLLLAGATFAFALGVRGHGSIFRERSFGRLALAGFGTSVLVGTILRLGAESWFAERLSVASIIAIVNSVVGLVFLTIGALAMVRSQSVGRLLSWPLLVLACICTVANAAALLPAWASELQQADPGLLLLIGVLSTLLEVAMPVLLGASAIIASARQHNRHP